MVDLIALGIALLVVLAVLLRRTSAGVAILGLLAGVMLDQLLSEWLIGLIPNQSTVPSEYVSVAVHLLITFTPVVIALLVVKVAKHNVVLSLLASLVLGFLIFFFGLKIVAPLPQVKEAASNSGLLHFLQPYQNQILAAGAVIALLEMTLSHQGLPKPGKKKRK